MLTSVHNIFWVIIDYILGHKTNFTIFKMSEIVHNVISDKMKLSWILITEVYLENQQMFANQAHMGQPGN